MYSTKTLLAAAATTVAMAAGVCGASAAPWDRPGDHPGDHRPTAQRPIVVRERVFDTLRFHHYRGIGAPLFVRGHYVVRSYDPLGRVVFVEVDLYTGAFIGEFRV